MLASVVFFAIMTLGVKYTSRIPSHEIVFLRSLIVLIFCFGLLKRVGVSPWGNHRSLLFVRGVSGTIALTMYFYTLQRMPLASAVTIQLLSPIFVVVIVAIWLRESPRLIQWLCLPISFGGVLLIKGFDPRVAAGDLTIGIVSAFFTGLAYATVRKLRQYDHPLVIVLWFPLVTTPAIGLYSVFHWVSPRSTEWLILLMIGLFAALAQICMTKSYQLERVANVSNLSYLNIVLAISMGYCAFGEIIGLPALLGIALIIGGSVVNNIFRRES
ncbi:MAG: DMT family transporter [Patescibacteria group bacterium]